MKTDYEKCASMLQDTQSELTSYMRQNNQLLLNSNRATGGGDSVPGGTAIILNHRSTPASQNVLHADDGCGLDTLDESCVDVLAHTNATKPSPPVSYNELLVIQPGLM